MRTLKGIKKRYYFTFWLYEREEERGTEKIYHEIIPVTIIDSSLESAIEFPERLRKTLKLEGIKLKEVTELQ